MTFSPTASFSESANFTGFRSEGAWSRLRMARSAVVSVPTTLAVYICPLERVTWISWAPSTTWLLVTTWPWVSKTAPDPAPTPLLVCTWMETTDSETCLLMPCQSGACPPSTLAVPWPEELEETPLSEEDEGRVIHPLDRAAQPRPSMRAAATRAATTAVKTYLPVPLMLLSAW